MRSGSIGPDKLGLALDLIKKRPERRSLIFLKFNRAKDVLSTIVSLKKKKKQTTHHLSLQTTCHLEIQESNQ
jgi:hypothetical protein